MRLQRKHYEDQFSAGIAKVACIVINLSGATEESTEYGYLTFAILFGVNCVPKGNNALSLICLRKER